jgi:hypothetical protein
MYHVATCLFLVVVHVLIGTVAQPQVDRTSLSKEIYSLRGRSPNSMAEPALRLVPLIFGSHLIFFIICAAEAVQSAAKQCV